MNATPMTRALLDVADERRRQVDVEGWTAEHDDWHRRGEMALVAALYASPRSLFDVNASDGCITWDDPWPFYKYVYAGREQGDDPPSRKILEGDKRAVHDQRKKLVIAGALIIAEIERLDRADLLRTSPRGAP